MFTNPLQSQKKAPIGAKTVSEYSSVNIGKRKHEPNIIGGYESGSLIEFDSEQSTIIIQMSSEKKQGGKDQLKNKKE